MMLWPRITISPTCSSPGGSGLLVVVDDAHCTPQIGLPIEQHLALLGVDG